MRTSSFSADLRYYLRACAGYALAALLVMAPALLRIASAIPGGPVAAVDGWQNVWNLWWVQRALASGHNPFFSDMIFYPQGVSLALQTLGLSNGILALPVTAIWGPAAGYNAAVLLALILCGLAGCALALEVSGDRLVAFLAGLIFTCSPYHLTRIYDGQLELIALQWPTFYALFFFRALAGRAWRDALLAGLFLALTGYTSLYYLIFMAIFSLAGVLVWSRPRAPGPSPARAQVRAGGGVLMGAALAPPLIIGLSGLLLLLPLLLPALATATGRSGKVAGIPLDEVIYRSANLLDVLLPSYLHPLWGQWVFVTIGNLWHNYTGDWNGALGYSVLALAVLGSAANWRAAWRWWLIVGLAVIFSLGPQLQVGIWHADLPMPFRIFELLPGLSLGRRPALFVALTTIALVPPLALGLRVLRRAPWLLGLALLLAAFELWPPPWPAQVAAVHPYYQQLVGRPGALLEIPPARYKYSLPQLAQITHGRPIFGGYLARSPDYPLPEEAPVLSALWRVDLPADPLMIEGMDDPLVPLNYYGVGDLVVHWDKIYPEQRALIPQLIERVLPGVTPEYQDATISVYHVPSATPQPFAGIVGEGWYPAESDGAHSWRWMGASGAILIVNPTSAALPVTLSLGAYGYGGSREVALSFDDDPAGLWQVEAGETTAALHLWLAPGSHRLTLQARADQESVANSSRALSIALLDARITIAAAAEAVSEQADHR